MAILRLFDPTTQFQTKSGALNVAGKLRVYVESTDDLANIYCDDGSLLSQPLILDSNGRARGLFVDSGRSYRLEVYDRHDSLLYTIRKLEPNASGTIVNPTIFIKGTPDEIDVEDSVTDESRTYTVSLSAKVTGKIAENREAIVKESEARKNADDELRTLIDGISKVEAGTASPLMDGKASVGNSLKYAREDHVHPSDTSREDIANKTTVVLGTSDSKYPTDKAVAEFVNSSIATNTANYISNNGEPFTSVAQLEAYSGPVTNNDYAFVTGIDSEGNTYYDRYKATVSGETVTWALEYRLNNSSFTAAQWSAINSGITSALVAKIHTHSNKDVLDGITSSDVANWNSKQNSLTFDSEPTAGSTNPVTSNGINTAIVNKASQFSLGSTAGSRVYTMFARTPDANPENNFEAQVILSSAGNYGSTNQGTWEIIVSNRGSTASSPKAYMTVRCINAVKALHGAVTEPTFGYYIDTTNHYIYFGIYSAPYRGQSRITVLVNNRVTLQDFGDSTTAPTGWTTVTPTGVSSAVRLDTARTIQTDLASTSSASFDGTANITPGVTGTLPVANGGTGATTPAGAQFNLIDKATTELSPMEDKHRIAIMSPEPSATNSVIAGYRTGLTMWNYMKGKMSSDTGVNISGNAATAGTADKAVADNSGNNIEEAYAKKTELNKKGIVINKINGENVICFE